MNLTNATMPETVVEFDGFFEVRRSPSSVTAFVVEVGSEQRRK
jgi:hypothetical protein